MRDAIAHALRQAGISAGIHRLDDLSGGCIHRVVRVRLDDGSSVVAKLASESRSKMLAMEQAGLAALAATKTVLVSQPLVAANHDSTAVLLMSDIESAPATAAGWHALGRELAALHEAPVGSRYGFQVDNYIGATPQVNTWSDDWIEFNAVHRLGHQVRLARQAGLLNAQESGRVEVVIDHLSALIPRRPRPALLHGDLWSGNALPTRDAQGRSRIALIDPACSIGDGLADVAMMGLFGGFPDECFDEYFAQRPDQEQLDSRLMVYQLYHVLNHVNLFGRGYVGQAMNMADALAG